MDCDLARLLTTFSHAPELDAADTTALQAHLAGCASCAAHTARQTQFDQVVRTAMRAVPVPPGGRATLISRLQTRHTQTARRKIVVGTGAALAFALVVGLGVGALGHVRPAVDTHRAALDSERVLENPPGLVAAFLTEAGVPGQLPADFDFAHYVAHGRLPLLGTSAPGVVFALPGGAGGRPHTATAFVLSRNRYQIKDIQDAQSSFYSVTVFSDPSQPDVCWLVIHTTPTLEPFLLKPDRPAG